MQSATQTAVHYYAAGTAYRTLFAKSRTPSDVQKYLQLGKEADLALINAPIRTPEDAVIKLSLAIDWLGDDASENALRMLESVLAYNKSQCGASPPTKGAAAVPEATPSPAIAHRVEVWREDDLAAMLEAKDRPSALALAETAIANIRSEQYGKGTFTVSVQELSDDGTVERQLFEQEITSSNTGQTPPKEARKIKTNRASHPTWVDGVLYPSQAKAAKALNMTRYELIKRIG